MAKENCGDPILTKGFKMMVHDIGYEPVFCHKSDPESKGKVENVKDQSLVLSCIGKGEYIEIL